MDSIFGKVYNIDSRALDEVISDQLIDVTITSPPYFDLKDYGCDGQIGFGQGYEDYLEDLKLVFEKVFNCTKNTGTLWVVIDVFRRNGQTIPLPFDFANKIKEVGWKLQEIIIWGKDRTVPWTHKGQMRNLFEYILMFSKSDDYNFFVDEVRDFESLKKWWIKYPERYNPKGKTPDAIWNFDIPTQGSWGNGYIDHFCPLPEDLISQILKLTTTEGGHVMDVFSGSGAVLAKADNMNRKYIGFELNPEYIAMFQRYLKQTGEAKRVDYEFEKSNRFGQNSFYDLIINLRVLKFARVCAKKINDRFRDSIKKILVVVENGKPEKLNALVRCKYIILARESDNEEMYDQLKIITDKAPLSKFGIEAEFLFKNDMDSLAEFISNEYVYIYTDKVTHKFKKRLLKSDLSNTLKSEIIISEIMVDLNEADYE